MDALILGGAVVVLTAVVYILATFSTKETPFEEAIAEQRQKRDTETVHPKTEKIHKKTKLKRGKKKEEGDGTAPSTVLSSNTTEELESELEIIEAEVVPEPSPFISEPEPSPKPTQEKKKEKKKKKDKDREDDGPRRIVVEEVSEIAVQKGAEVPVAAKKEAEKVVEQVAQVQVEELEEENVERHTPTLEKRKKKEKIKIESTTGVTSVSETKLLAAVQRAILSGGEIQQLIDVLLNKQQQATIGGEWVAKGAKADPTALLRKKIDELEIQMKGKDDAHSALSSKITDLRGELNSERARASKLKAQFEETSTVHTRQMDVAASQAQSMLTQRLAELRTTLEEEFNIKLQQVEKQCSSSVENEQQVQQLKITISESEIQSAVLRQEHEELTQRCQKYEEHITGLEKVRSNEELSYKQQIKEAQGRLATTISEVSKLSGEREALSAQLASYSQDKTKEVLSQTQNKLKEVSKEKAEVEAKLAAIQLELGSSRQIIGDQTAEIERLKDEKDSLAVQSVRPAAEGQENGDIHTEQVQSTVPYDSEKFQIKIQEKEKIIEEHATKVAQLSKDVVRLKEEIESHQKKNNELRDKNSKIYEALKSTEESLKSKLISDKDTTEERIQVRAILRKLFPSIVVDEKLDQSTFLSAFETKASQVATQTPEVKEKIVEVEKVVEKVVYKDNPDEKRRVEQLIQENVHLSSQVMELQHMSSNVSSNDDRLAELQEEIHNQTEKVAHYQTVLADTENLLKSLQASVEGEEAAWRAQLEEKESTVRQLTADKGNLLLKISSLEGTLVKVQQADENAHNGPACAEEVQEDMTSSSTAGDSLSIISDSSISNTELSPAISSADKKKKEKKKKSLFSKIMGKGTNP